LRDVSSVKSTLEDRKRTSDPILLITYDELGCILDEDENIFDCADELFHFGPFFQLPHGGDHAEHVVGEVSDVGIAFCLSFEVL
jgi:hypothetical protein